MSRSRKRPAMAARCSSTRSRQEARKPICNSQRSCCIMEKQVERQALGKGLGALFTSLPASGDVQQLELGRIFPNRHQPRQHFDDASLKELAESIRQRGIVQPVLVRRGDNGGYELIAGERRWRAAQIAGLAAIPAIVKEVTEVEQLQLAMIENLQREDLNPMEAAPGYQRL